MGTTVTRSTRRRLTPDGTAGGVRMDWKADETLLALIKRGKESGSLTFDEVNQALPELSEPGLRETHLRLGGELLPHAAHRLSRRP